jgi:hypothetical protein
MENNGCEKPNVDIARELENVVVLPVAGVSAAYRRRLVTLPLLCALI